LLSLQNKIDITYGNSFLGGNSGPKSNKNSGGSSGPGNGKNPGGNKQWWQSFFENYQQQIWLATGLALGAGYLLMYSGMPVREINWQEFRTNYLEKGDVSW
jgi:AFG3 family protein